MAEIIPIGPGVESVGVMLWAADPSAARWDRDVWGGGRWGAVSWQSVGCDVTEATSRWGATQELGILSIAEAGALDLQTYDPNRELDPLNTRSPYYGAVRPGTPLRLEGRVPGRVSGDLLGGTGSMEWSTRPPDWTGNTALYATIPGLPAQLVANPGFESGTSGWSAINANATGAAVSSANAIDGANVLRVSSANATAGTGGMHTDLIPVVPGVTYKASAYVGRGAGTVRAGRLRIATYDAGGTVINATAGQVDRTPAAVALEPFEVSYTVPTDGTVASLRVGLLIVSGVTGDTLHFDAVRLDGPTYLADGARTLRLVGDGVIGTPAAIAGSYAVQPGDVLTLAGSIGSPSPRQAALRLDGLDAGGANIANNAINLSSPASSPELFPVSGSYTVPADGSVASVRVRFAGLSTPLAVDQFYFDGVTLTGMKAGLVGKPAATTLIDEASFDLAESRGRIRSIDGIAYLAQAQVPDGTVLPNTMRARARAVVAAVGLASLVPCEAEAATDPDVDPPVAPHDGKSAPAWQVIQRAAEDSLTYVWLDPTGTLRFRSWGSLPDAPLNGIGCPPADADPSELWLEGLSTIVATAGGDGIRNSVRAYSSGTTWSPATTDGASIGRYGPRPFDVDRVVPSFSTWAARILADRADAGLELAVGQLRPYSLTELDALLAAGLVGASTLRVYDASHGDPVDLDVGLIGAKIGVTPAGWRWELVTMLSRVEWDDIEPPVPPDPIPPADPWHTEQRTYIASSDALLALTSGGAKYGAGASSTLPVGGWQGWTYRSVIAFPAIPWTKVRAVKGATLKVSSTSQVRVGFGSTPKTTVQRITSSWSAGSSSTPSSGNAVVWPGPSTTSSGQVTAGLSRTSGAVNSINVLGLVKPWAPSSIGGSSAPQYGLELREYSSSTGYTGEVWPVEQGGASRPSLVLDLEVFD